MYGQLDNSVLTENLGSSSSFTILHLYNARERLDIEINAFRQPESSKHYNWRKRSHRVYSATSATLRSDGIRVIAFM